MNFSVLLSVYKEEKPEYLNKALESIWDYQKLKPDEIVLVKDGPLHNDLNSVIDGWLNKVGKNFTVVSLTKNVGLGAALNKGLISCSNNLVARMDTDDISLPDRFIKQVTFMEKNANIAVLSSWVEEINEANERTAIRKLPTDHKNIVSFGKSRNPISHPAVIFRKDAVLSVGGYPEFKKSQDYALWSLMLTKGFRFANLDKILLKMRTGESLMQRRNFRYFLYEFEILKFQKNIGFISVTSFIKNSIFRLILRLSPNYFKKLMYKYFR